MKIPQTKRYSIYKELVLQDERSKKLNFTSDGRKHYVYRVSEMQEHYYGSRTSKKEVLEDDFWKYGTSSTRKKQILASKNKFKLKIIKVFDNAGDKILYESFLHQYFNVKEKNNNFWNNANQTPFGFNPNLYWTDEHKEKHSKAMKGKRNPMFKNGHTQEIKNKLKALWNTKEGKEICSSRARLGWNDKRKLEQSNLFSGDNNPSKRKEVKEKMRNAWTEERKTECTCEYCGMKNNKTNHKRWHGDNCKHIK